nr:hypothetical protein [Rhizobium ecuadorense]
MEKWGTDDAEDTQGDIHSPRPYPDWVGLVGFGYMQLHVVEPISIKLWLIRSPYSRLVQRSSGMISKIPKARPITIHAARFYACRYLEAAAHFRATCFDIVRRRAPAGKDQNKSQNSANA